MIYAKKKKKVTSLHNTKGLPKETTVVYPTRSLLWNTKEVPFGKRIKFLANAQLS